MILCREEHAKAINSAVFPGQQGGPLDARHRRQGRRAEHRRDRALPRAPAAHGRRRAGRRRGAPGAPATASTCSPAAPTCTSCSSTCASPSSTASMAEDRLHEIGITVNRNAVPFDPRPPMVTSGLRVGTRALATRGLRRRGLARGRQDHRDGADAGLRRPARRAGRARHGDRRALPALRALDVAPPPCSRRKPGYHPRA